MKAAFSATGVWPYNPDAIRDEQLKPSLPTSIKGSFPIPQSSPVRAIISALGAYRPTAFERSPTHFAPIPSLSRLPTSTSSTPTSRRRPHNDVDDSDSVIDPTLWDSPSKRMRMLHGALGSTSSGSLLLSTPRLTSYNPANPTLQSLPPLPQPDWSLLNQLEPDLHQTREMALARQKSLTESLHNARTTIAAYQHMEEASNAQIILQHLEVTKLAQSLEAKEKKKESERTMLFPEGVGTHFTADEFVNKWEMILEAKKTAASAKETRKAIRRDKKAKKATLALEWKQVVEEHERAVVEWKEHCDRLLEEKMPRKDWPVKPRRVLKASLMQEETEEAEDDADEDDDDEEASDDD